MHEQRKNNYVWIGIATLTILFIYFTVTINILMVKQNKMIQDLSNVEYLSSSTQRVTRMIITDEKDEKVIYYLDEETSKKFNINTPESIFMITDDEIRDISDDVVANWKTLYALFQLPADDADATYDIDLIKLASDNHFNSMTNLALAINDRVEAVASDINIMQVNSYVMLVLLAFCICNYFINTSLALKQSAHLASLASLDASTGLFNRSKCQEIFKDNTPTNRQDQPAIIVIDLNDLKKTNDQYGHRVGDELITAFANLLKEASNIHTVKPFLGRYGGDEFIAYYKDIENEEEVNGFIRELAYLASEFNKDGSARFTISYAIGHAINKDRKEVLTARKLFEEADEAMYENKKMMKDSLGEPSEEQV